MANEAQKIISEELKKLRSRKKYMADNVFIQCPYHGSDSTPSLSIYIGTAKTTGLWKCFGCAKAGNWNQLAKDLGMKNLDVGAQQHTSTTKYFKKISNDILESYTDGSSFDWPATKNWRSISGSVLSRIKTRFMFDEDANDICLLIPVEVNKKLMGVVKAVNEKREGALSYVNSSGAWVNDFGMLGYSLCPKNASLVLCEGPRDALRLWMFGIPAIAILGAGNWTDNKKNYILSLKPKKVVLAFDNDRAGVEATNTLFKDLSGLVKTEIIRMAALAKERGIDKMDPGNCPEDVIEIIRKATG